MDLLKRLFALRSCQRKRAAPHMFAEASFSEAVLFVNGVRTRRYSDPNC